MKYPRWIFSLVTGYAIMGFAGAFDPYSIKDVDGSSLRDLSRDITQVDLFQSEDHRLLFRVTFAAPPTVEHLRIMLDVDSARGESASGADYMLEGTNFYRYPEEAVDWTWDAIEPPFILVEGCTVICLFPALPLIPRARWFVETTNPDWSLADRLPQTGTSECVWERLPKLDLQTKLSPEDIGALVSNASPSLCLRFNPELKSQTWQKSTCSEKPMSWKPIFSATSLPLRVVLFDAVSHESVKVEPDQTFVAGDHVEWSGEDMGIEWIMRMDPLEHGDVRLTGQLQAAGERCVSVGIGCEMDLRGWTWHDDIRFQRLLLPPARYANVVSCPFGVRGERSIYPFAVISSDLGSLITETEVGEPRIYQLIAGAGDSFFGVFYDFGLSSLTSNFPNRATFCCVLRSSNDKGDNAFRQALAEFYDRNANDFLRTVPVVGGWLPFTNPTAISNVVDFGFTYYESAGSRVAGTDSGGLTFGRTEPWLYWLPIPKELKRTENELIQRIKFLAGCSDRRAELAASALLGAARRTDGSIRMKFLDLPRNSGVRLEINTDPDLPPTAEWPLNRAMSEWREITQFFSAGLQGILLDSMLGQSMADYNPVAMAVADYPCTYERDVLKPCLPIEWSAYEYVEALSHALKARGKYMMGNFSCVHSPFFFSFLDVMGEEIEGGEASLCQIGDDRAMNFRRALSGHKPYVILLNTSFDKLTVDFIRQYFERSMFWGFLPGFYRDANFRQSYWENSKWYDRDRALFKTYIPLIRRLAQGGWRARGDVESLSSNVWVECFDDTVKEMNHITLRNMMAAPTRAVLRVEPRPEPLLIINPLVADCMLIDSNETQFPVALSPFAIETRDLMPVSALHAERAFAQGWDSGAAESTACFKVLESVRAELNLDVLCNVSYTALSIRGETNTFHLVIQNRGQRRLEVGDLKIISTKQYRPFEIAVNELEPSGRFVANGFYSSDDIGKNPWLEVQWTLRDGATEVVCTRMIHPQYP